MVIRFEVVEAVAHSFVDVVLEERQAPVGEVQAHILVPVLQKKGYRKKTKMEDDKKCDNEKRMTAEKMWYCSTKQAHQSGERGAMLVEKPQIQSMRAPECHRGEA